MTAHQFRSPLTPVVLPAHSGRLRDTAAPTTAPRPSDILDESFLLRTSPRWDRASKQAGFRDMQHAMTWARTVHARLQSENPIRILADRLCVPYSVLVSVTDVWAFFAGTSHPDAAKPSR